MSPDAETRERPGDLDSEPEVDLGRFWRAILVRWWVILIGVVVGAIIGLLVSLGGGKQFKATAQVYLGQPLSPSGEPVSSTSTSLGLASYFVTSENTLRAVERRIGLTRGKLRGHVSSKPILGLTGGKLGTAAPILAVTVTGSSRDGAARAANEIGRRLIQQLGPYSAAKLESLQAQLDRDANKLKGVNTRLSAALDGQSRLLAATGIGSTEKLVALSNFNLVVVSAISQQASLESDQYGVTRQMAEVKNIEQPRMVSPASGVHAAGPSRRSGVVVGAIIGFVLGILVAVLWEPVATRVRQAA